MKKNVKKSFFPPRKLRKLLLTMKMTAILVLLASLKLSANVYSQNTTFTMKLQGQSLIDVMKEIRRTSEFTFVYELEDVEEVKNISVDCDNAIIDKILDNCLGNSSLTYEIIDRVVVLKQETNQSPNLSQQEKYDIKGKVINEKGIPMPGVTVWIEGVSSGTVTDNEGLFEIHALRAEGEINVTFIGMRSQKIAFKSGKFINVVLEVKEEDLSEVVVTGYANISKESFTGNPISISQDEILQVSKSNIVQALQTFDPSFRILENNIMGSDPNALPEMYIRGRSGIGVKELDKNDFNRASLENNPNLPTFIMDGFEVSVEKVYDMDPTRIKGITILKDAAATAMYGSRAANGVVVITTVAPKAGKLRLSYNFTGSLSVPDLSDYNLMNARELLETEKAAGFYEGEDFNETTKLTEEYNEKYRNITRGVDTYWLSKPLQTVLNSKHNLYIEGGEENIRFGVNLNYTDEDGVMKDSYRDRMSAGFYIDYRFKNFQIKNHISYSVKKSQESPYGSFSEYASALPYDEYKDEYGQYLVELRDWHSSSRNERINPLYESTLQNFSRSNYEELINNLSLNWSINDYLRLKGQFSVTKKDIDEDAFLDPLSSRNTNVITTGNMASGELRTNRGERLDWNLNALLSYNRLIKKHNINFTAGINAVSNQSHGISSLYRGFPSGTLHSPNFAQEIYETPNSNEQSTRLIGFLSSLNYTYNNIYLVDMSYRLDGSSEFGSENKFAPFWAAGFGINFHNYDFLRNNNTISHLKLRSSLGSAGKVNFPSYVAKTTYEVLDDWYRTGFGTALKALGNENLSWEKTKKLDIGFELGLFNDKLFIEGSYYNEKTVDLITEVSIPSSSGFSIYFDNLGEVENKGYELSVRADIVKTKDVNVALFANAAHNKNKILKISKSLQAYNEKVDDYYKTNKSFKEESMKAFTKYEEGGSLTAVYGMKSLGIDPATGNELYQKRDGSITYDWNAAEQVVIGNTEPKVQGSFGANLRYKNFSLYTSFMYRYGGQSYNYTLVSKVENAAIYSKNVDKRVFDSRWKEVGDISMYKSIKDDGRFTQPTSRFMQDYNMVSLSSLTLGYEVDRELLKKVGISMLRFELGANNLVRFSTVKEERGTSYPFARVINFSLKASF